MFFGDRTAAHGRVLKASVSTAALLSAALASPAFAQADAPPAQNAPPAPAAAPDEAAREEIVVTGSRLRASGFDAPTPTTIVSLEQIQSAAPKQIDDFINQLPSIAGSMTLRTRSIQASNGTNGISTPSLRGIGTHRTLVLLDGQRSVPVTQTGETDVLSFPQQLISRVDVVTGGASAVYGSDALAGVVNFILDTRFKGIKAEASGGVTTYGDDWNYKLAATYGTSFAGGRGHIVLSGEYQWNQGVGKDYKRLARGTPPDRDWLYGAPIYVNNPAFAPGNGQPQYISNGRGAAAQYTPGGIIFSGPLMGTAFTNAGVPYRFNYGICDVGCSFMLGGDWRQSDVSVLSGLDPIFERANFFSRAQFDVSDKTNVFVQYMRSEGDAWGNLNTRQFIVNLRRDNPFLPQSVRDAAVAAGIGPTTNIPFGTFQEGEVNGGYVERQVQRLSAGAKGEFAAFGDSFDWNFYVQRGTANVKEQVSGNYFTARLTRAIDAVVDPNSGAIVCRVNVDTNPANDDPACVPLNIIGWDNFMDPAAENYVFQRSTRRQRFTQDVASFDIAGEPFELWAGPLAIALGAEHRREKTRGKIDRFSAQNLLRTNPLPINGKYHVTEGFVEVQVPLIRNASFTKSLDVNGAARATQYSTSGFVTTWKAGMTWEPIESIRFRATRSRDIRAPSMAELFTQGLNIFFAARDPFAGGVNRPNAIQSIVGNRNLLPEKADTLGLGVVFQPTFLPGFRASIDWYRIKIKDAIGTVDSQTIIDECFAGNQLFCPGVIREDTDGDGMLEIVRINQQPFNFASEEHSGIDIEARYARRMLGGNVTLHALTTHFIKARLDNGISDPYDYVGEHDVRAETPSIASMPRWKYRASVTYDREVLATNLTVRGISSGKWNNDWVGCTSNCPNPADLPTGWLTVDDNHAEAAWYLDGTITFRPRLSWQPELFLNVQNILNKDPAILARGPGGLAYGTHPSNAQLYDTLGRTFTAGLRVRM